MTALVAVALVLVVLSMGVVGRRAIALDGFATADYLVRHSHRVGRAELVARTQRAKARLAPILVAVAVTAGAAGVWLAVNPSPVPRLVALLAGLSLALRSLLFDRGPARAALLLGGGAVAVTAVVNLVRDPFTGPWWPYAVGGALAGVVLAIQQAGTPGRRSLLHWLEATAVTTLVCALGIELGLMDLIAKLAGL